MKIIKINHGGFYMAKGYDLTKNEEAFVAYLAQGYNQQQAYTKAYINSKNMNYGTIATNACNVLKKENVKQYYDEMRRNINEILINQAVWTKEQAINELKDILYKNKRESDRYDQAYDDEIEILDRQIKGKEEELSNPKKYLSRKKMEQLQNEIDDLKMQRIKANRRHQSNRNVNDAILQAVLQLNTMLGFDKKEDDKTTKIQAQVSFIDDVPETDEED